MAQKDLKKLPTDLKMSCYACECHAATHICRFQVGNLAVQVCLCDECLKMDTDCLLKNTIGIQDVPVPYPNSWPVL